MKIIGVTMASNEADVIEAFVRHNLQFLDAMVVLDHASVDSTGERLAALAANLPLIVLRDRERAFRQGERITMMARRYLAELEADWCLAMDADEFIRCDSRAALARSLGAVPAGVHGLVPLQNYVGATPESLTQSNPLRRMRRRLRTERAVSRKVAIRRGFETLPSGQVSLGNHAVLQVVDGKAVPLPHVPLEGVTYAHVPIRSPQQAAQKALLGWLAMRLTRPERYARPGEPHPANHWKVLYDRVLAGGAIDTGFMADAIAAYVGGPVRDDELVDDPVSTVELASAEGADARAMVALARWSEQLVEDVLAAAERRGA